MSKCQILLEHVLHVKNRSHQFCIIRWWTFNSLSWLPNIRMKHWEACLLVCPVILLSHFEDYSKMTLCSVLIARISNIKTKIMALGPITSWQIDRETVTDFIFLGSKITADGDCSNEIKRCLLLGRKAMTNLDSMLKKQRHHYGDKGLSSQSYGFSSGHVWMWELDHKESWALKNWCFSTVMLEKTLESPLDTKEIQQVHPKWNQFWILIGKTDAEAETPVLRPPDAKNWLIGKDPDAGKDQRQEEKGMTDNEMVEWHHWLDGCGFKQALGDGDGQGSLACWCPWGCKETQLSNCTELIVFYFLKFLMLFIVKP